MGLKKNSIPTTFLMVQVPNEGDIATEKRKAEEQVVSEEKRKKKKKKKKQVATPRPACSWVYFR